MPGVAFACRGFDVEVVDAVSPPGHALGEDLLPTVYRAGDIIRSLERADDRPDHEAERGPASDRHSNFLRVRAPAPRHHPGSHSRAERGPAERP